MIRIVGKRGKGPIDFQLDEAARSVDFMKIDCTSDNVDENMKALSPFHLGPVACYDGLRSETFERAWQCAKVYPWLADAAGNPSASYFRWRDEMWATKGFHSKVEIRFPAGRGNSGKRLYAWWKVNGAFQKLGYVEARKEIYIPLYAKAVAETDAFRRLCRLRDEGRSLLLLDFDGYNIHHPWYNFTYNDAIHCPLLKMGHGFVLAMMLEGLTTVEGGEVHYAEGLMTPPNRTWPVDLRKVPPELLRLRNAKRLGVTPEEFDTLDAETRTWLYHASEKKTIQVRGFTKAGWKRLPLEEKLTWREDGHGGRT